MHPLIHVNLNIFLNIFQAVNFIIKAIEIINPVHKSTQFIMVVWRLLSIRMFEAECDL